MRHTDRLALAVALLCAPVLFGAPSEYSGNFTLTFEPAKTAALKPVEQDIRESHLLDDTIDELNDTLALPQDLNIVFKECGAVNAFYDQKNTRVLMCYELLGFFKQQFAEIYEDQADAEAAVLDSTLFVFHHELGHALVHLLELPITGKEEDAVDDLATLVLLRDWEGGDESALSAADAFYRIGEQEEAKAGEGMEMLPYYGEHSLGKQRYYQIACIVYGSDPEAHAGLVGDGLPKARAERCPAEFAQKSKSWNTLLSGYYAAADEEEVEENAAELKGAFGDVDREEDTVYQVVINHEGQYSIWPEERELPAGWKAEGTTGTKTQCREYIKSKWAE